MMNNRLPVYVSLLAGLILGLRTVPANASPDKPNVADVAWRQLLHRGLAMYWREQYKDVFVLIEKSVRRGQPGPGVHRALALMRKASLKCRDSRQRNRDWKAFMFSYVKNLASKPKLTDTDLVLLSLVKESSDRTVNEAVLDRLLAEFPHSSWHDWAFWEKARTVGSRASLRSHPLGVVTLQGNKSRVGCLVMKEPQLWIQGRAAKTFLRSHRDSYMAETMRVDLARWRWTVAIQALSAIEQNVWYVRPGGESAFPLTKRQIEAITGAIASINSVEAMLPEATKRRLAANVRLDDFLWELDDRWKIVDYFEEITKIPDGEGYMLQKDIVDWIGPLLEQRRKQKAKWHRWEPTSAPATRPAAKPQQNTGKP